MFTYEMNPFTSKESRISSALQMVSALAICATFFGFLVVNIYLALFGFWDFNFLKVQYFTAGGLFLFFLAFPATLFYAFLKAKEVLEKYRAKDRKVIKSFLVVLFEVLLFGVGLLLSLALFMFPLLLGNTIHPASVVYFLGFIWVGFIFAGVGIAVKSHSELSKASTMHVTLQNIAIYFGAYYRLLYFLLALPVLVFMFSFLVYSSVPRYLGGGRPVAVSIGLNSNLDGKEIGVASPFNAILVYESENSVLVLIDGGTYLIKQDEISYVKYLATAAQIHGLQDFKDLNSTTTPQ